MNPELIDRIEEAVEPLAQAAGKGAEYAWGVLIRQAVLTGVSFLVAALVVGAITATFALATRRAYIHRHGLVDATWHQRESATFTLVTTTVGSLITLGITLALLHAALTRLLNPGFFALDALARVVGA